MSAKIKVRHPNGSLRLCGAGTDDAATLADMRAWLLGLKRAGRLDVIEAIVSGRVKLTEAYRLRRSPDAILAVPGSRNVEPCVDAWHAEKCASRKGAGSADAYRTQVRLLIPAGKPFSASLLDTQRLRKWIGGLDVQDPTRNRYRAALSSFCAYLVREGVLARNPVADLGSWSEGAPRQEWYELEEAARVIERMPAHLAGAAALAVTAGLEVQVLERLRVRDVNLATGAVWADGGKNAWRRRESRVLPKLSRPAFTAAIEAAVKGKLPDALVFPCLGFKGEHLLDAFKAAAIAAGLRVLRVHDQRHTFAVAALRAGYRPTTVSHCLGHRDTTLVWRTYGRYATDDRDFAAEEASSPASADVVPFNRNLKAGGAT